MVPAAHGNDLGGSIVSRRRRVGCSASSPPAPGIHWAPSTGM
jgi:hypothetical protein